MTRPDYSGSMALGLIAVLISGCGDAPPPAVRVSAAELRTPAGEDSGQPFLSSSGDAVFMSWLGRSEDGLRVLIFSSYASGAWEEPRIIGEGERLLVNVADFPSVVRGPDGVLWSHWLERRADGAGYGVRVSRSTDGGVTWAPAWTPHEDRSPTDHGFVSLLPLEGLLGVVWLDGRGFAPSPDGSPPSSETALFFRAADAEGPAGPETVLDPRVCDCCQTDVAVTGDGAVVVYRDRSPDEVRDIRVVRLSDGAWSEPRIVHQDDWETGACPINGPAVAASGDRVAVAWFTAADGEPMVQASLSDDGGRTFGRPARVDDGAPAGRVDVVLLDDGTALVSWVERGGGERSDVRVRRVAPGGHALETLEASAQYAERVVGFPRLARAAGGAILVAWTDGTELTPKVRLTRIEVEES